MKKGLLILTFALMALAPVTASARVFVGVGGYWGPYWGPGYYGYYGGYGYPAAGQVRLDTKVKNAEVFINGAFAGTTHQAKSLYLRPGSYNIEIRELGATKFAEQVYVAPGKTLHLHPQL
jgi:PEGA domain